MGAYLSQPVTDKISSDEVGEHLTCGASSMQGWRVSQEDAHNCIIEYDKNTSLFAVYDGHGGHEVALYCSQKLPDYIKSTDAYKKGDLKQALIDAYIGFDATIAEREIVAILKELAGAKKNDENDEALESEDEENIDNLYKEADMPLEQVMEKYSNPLLRKLQDGTKCPVSPYLKARSSNLDEASSSGEGSSGVKSRLSTDSDASVSSSSSCTVLQTNNGKETEKISNSVPDSSIDCSKESCEKSKEENEATAKNNLEKIKTSEMNGDVISTSTSEEVLENGSSGKIEKENKVKGKGKALSKSPVKGEEPENEVVKSKLVRQTVKHLFESLLAQQNEDESDSEDENDRTFEGVDAEGDETSDEEEHEGSGEDGEEDESSDEVEDEDEDEDEEEEEEDDNEFTMNMTEEPGSDSGCTAVVALLNNDQLFVANAGDSRCIVCRNGTVIEMSVDHKPETEEENARITKAGGKVTADGRVNGGLNLSRAIGDHAYKQNKDLPAQEQMITALPDVMTLTINPTEDEFMVLACDGIWNYMSSEQVMEFVRTRLNEGREKISQICEEMFDHCLAPNTMGDGTGCDNMTAIIVQFKTGMIGCAKRPASSPQEDTSNSKKRAKTEEDTVVSQEQVGTTTTSE